jgi:serine/threonine protein kinase/Tol biopolymer transport system component
MSLEANPDRVSELERLCLEALALPREQRAAYLDSACSDDAMRCEVESLLAEESDAAAMFRTASGHRLDEPQFDLKEIGTAGVYEIQEKLGEGGMGMVFRARQTSPVTRDVALKIIHPEMASKQLVSRFLVERQALAMMDHPNIARVLDAGETSTGLPYLAMELVVGRAITDFCDERKLDVNARVELFIQVCEAIQHAHNKGILHRDVKPSNVLVADYDGRTLPKVIDFGIAKAMRPLRVGITNATNAGGMMLGTLEYMSPEQTDAGIRDDLDARSDVYSLGALLYRLVCGRAPLDRSTLEQSSYDEVLRLIRVEVPPSASRVTRNGAIRELDWILAKALEKDRNRRYQSAGAFALDLRRYLNREPLEAGPPSATYRLRKLAAKYRNWSAPLIVAMFLGIGLGGWFVWGRLRAPEKLTLRQLTVQIPENRVTTASISRDGKLLSYATVDGIFLKAMPTGEARLLQSPGDFSVDRIRWLSGGDRLIAGGISRTTSRRAIWIVSTSDAAPVLLRENARDPEPSPDGSQIAFADPTRSELWLTRVSGEETRRVLTAAPAHLVILFWSTLGTHLVFTRISTPIEGDPTAGVQRFSTTGLFLASYESLDLQSGQIVVRRPDLMPLSAAVLQSGSALFLSPDLTNRSGSILSRIKTDPRTAVPVAPPVRLSLATDFLTDVSASSDGRAVSLVKGTSQSTVHVGDYTAAAPAILNVRRLALDASTSFPHAWTTDSRAVIFESDRDGNNDLFRQNLDSRVSQMLIATPREDFHANLTPDGRWLLFMQGPLGSLLPGTVARAPAAGGRPEEVVKSGVVDEFRCALPGGKRCIARAVLTDQKIYIYYELDPIRGLGRELARTQWAQNIYGDWALSPDGTEVAVPNHDPRTAVIRMLSLDKPEIPERELPIPGLANISGLNWTADGAGWFTVITTSVGARLVHVDRKGRVTPLLDHGGYTIPSPDGRRVAMMIPAITTNVWSVEGF